MRLTVVGCSGSVPGPDSSASCYLVEAGERASPDGGPPRPWRVVLDLGNGALGPLQRYTAMNEIDAVLISHGHSDHCVDLCALHVGLNYHPTQRPAQRLPVYGPSGLSRRLERAYGEHEHELDEEHQHQQPTLDRSFDFRLWQAGEPVQLGPIAITPHRMNHSVAAYGMRVVAGGAVLAYTGDTDSCDALLELAAGADLLLAEAAYVEGRDDALRGVHLTGRRAGEAARDAGAKRLMLTHLPPWNDPDVAVAEARAVYPGPIELAHSGLRLVVGP